MKKQLTNVSATLFLFVSISNGTVISNFSSGDEGWLVSGDATSGAPTFNATGGNPGGYLSATDSVASKAWYWEAPTKFTGNQSNAIGGMLEFQLQQSKTTSQFNGSDIIIAGTSLTLYFDTANNPGTSWTSYSVNINDSSGWKVGSLTGANATSADISSVFSNIGSLRIRGEFVIGADTGGLDNVRLVSVPEPSSSFILALGSMLLLRRRNR